MKYLHSLFLASLAAMAVSADSSDFPADCMGPDDISYILGGYQGLVSSYNGSDADRLLTHDFIGTSDSINAVAGLPIGSITFPSKAAFKQIQTLSPSVPLVITTINYAQCSFLAVRWNATFGHPPQNVLGMSMLWTYLPDGGDWKIKQLLTEFNSCTYLKNLGGNYTLAPAA